MRAAEVSAPAPPPPPAQVNWVFPASLSPDLETPRPPTFHGKEGGVPDLGAFSSRGSWAATE